ncbi:hypothetical protein [Cellulosimicrobium marinum]|uniref:hypothetical protein n=1 Tax=Cellulosimicrobium marinum TaxID=1638992 RepID=UPI001E2CD214|nr:hypothetical protein [Cellulosimicrobium marinum]MCB7137605.1 hypothetical protein [Cellulosimicrobium marinum]
MTAHLAAAPSGTPAARGPSPATGYPPLARLLVARDPEVGRLVRAADVGGGAAFQDLLRRGALVHVWEDVASPVQVPRTPLLRAAAVRDVVPSHCVVGGASAAWLLCGGPAPARLELLYPPGTHRPAPRPGRTARQAAVLQGEVLRIGDVRVTGVVRTALDVATRVDPDEALVTLRRLRDDHGLDPAVAARSLELRYRWPARERARTTLAALLADVGGPG